MKVEYEKTDIDKIIFNELKKEQQLSVTNYFNFYILNVIAFKPWGLEYPIMGDIQDNCSAWMMHINPNQSSSFHCHSKKISILHVLEGSIVVKTHTNPLGFLFLAGDIIVFNKGVFHSETTGQESALILQVETSLNKTDVYRFVDRYDRQHKPFENKSKVIYFEE